MSEFNRSVLVVDDEPEALQGYRDFLTESAAASVPKRSSRGAFGTKAGTAQVPAEPEFRVLTAASGEEALKIFESELKAGRPIAAGFFDVKLGAGMDGIALIHALQALDPDIHCAVVTAYQDRSVEEIEQVFGAQFKDQWDYLNKPFTRGEIVQKARQMLSAWNRKKQVTTLHDQLVRSERLAAVGQVARGIGHEFGNILLRIMGKADLALLEKDPVKVQENLKSVIQAAERAGVIVRNLQSFSKSEPVLKLDSIHRPIEECLSLVQHELVKASVKIDKKLAPEIPQTKMDGGALAQVFLNLFINAIHAMPKGGTLSIVTQVVPEGIEVQVADTGTGIPAEVLPKIFDYAFTTKGDQGSGLGLAISKEIVESHAGTLRVETQPGKGTQFYLRLPVRQ